MAIPVYRMVAKEIRLGGSFGGISLWDVRLRALSGNPSPEISVWENQCGKSMTGTSDWFSPRAQVRDVSPWESGWKAFSRDSGYVAHLGTSVGALIWGKEYGT